MTDDPVLKRFKQALLDTYGDRLIGARLFGSRARGDHRPDSDYDVAVELSNLPDRAKERLVLAELVSGLLSDTGRFVSAVPLGPGELEQRTPLMHEIRKDGVPL